MSKIKVHAENAVPAFQFELYSIKDTVFVNFKNNVKNICVENNSNNDIVKKIDEVRKYISTQITPMTITIANVVVNKCEWR